MVASDHSLTAARAHPAHDRAPLPKWRVITSNASVVLPQGLLFFIIFSTMIRTPAISPALHSCFIDNLHSCTLASQGVQFMSIFCQIGPTLTIYFPVIGHTVQLISPHSYRTSFDMASCVICCSCHNCAEIRDGERKPSSWWYTWIGEECKFLCKGKAAQESYRR